LPTRELLIADAAKRALLKSSLDGTGTVVSDSADDEALLGPNDLVIGPENTVYLTDPGLDLDGVGRILRIDLNEQQTQVVANGLRFPNGIVLSADARSLFVAESKAHCIRRYTVVDGGRKLADGEIFHQFNEFLPDGLALDSAGHLIVALHGGGVLAVLDADGRLSSLITTHGLHPTNCVFGGPNFQTLYVTEDDNQSLLAMQWPRPGQREFSRSMSSARQP
jgi:gluconolactonase